MPDLGCPPPSLAPTLFRRRSLLGGYKAHSEAIAGAKKHHGPGAADTGKALTPPPPAGAAQEEISDISATTTVVGSKRSRADNHARRRLSEAPVLSERMPGAELVKGSGRGSGAMGRGGGGGGGLARCQRLWKMVPQAKDNRPTWLKQYEVCAESPSRFE